MNTTLPYYLRRKLKIQLKIQEVISIENNTFKLFIFLLFRSVDQFKYEYIATHMRIMPWLVGIALGFAVCAIKAKRVEVRLPKV